MGKIQYQPSLHPEFCKACGLCIEACPKHCIELGKEIHPETGLVPVTIDLEDCNACGLCLAACPEPHGLTADTEQLPHAMLPSAVPPGRPDSEAARDTPCSLPDQEAMALKGTHAAAVGAILAGCRHFFGYPITPSTEGTELMAKLLPKLGGVYTQAVSEVAAVNMIYGCGAAGTRSMTFTSSPGFSLMLEGISYMIGAEVPGVFVNVMRGGPGLGNIAPEQSDIKLACRGLGHGNTHAVVLAPASPQEMLDLTRLAFDLSFKYRSPVIVAADGLLGQITGRVQLPRTMVRPGLPEWSIRGDGDHRRNVIHSLHLREVELERHNEKLSAKYQRMIQDEQRAEKWHCDDAEWILVAANSPAMTARGAVARLRANGIRAGLFRPITLWPFPVRELTPLLEKARGLVVVEASAGQLEDEMRLALSHASRAVHPENVPEIRSVRRQGGVLPNENEILECVQMLREVPTDA